MKLKYLFILFCTEVILCSAQRDECGHTQKKIPVLLCESPRPDSIKKICALTTNTQFNVSENAQINCIAPLKGTNFYPRAGTNTLTITNIEVCSPISWVQPTVKTKIIPVRSAAKKANAKYSATSYSIFTFEDPLFDIEKLKHAAKDKAKKAKTSKNQCEL